MYRLIDSHAHLEEIPSVEEALARARDAGVVAVVAVGSDDGSNSRVLELAARHKGYVFPALGLHPSNVARGCSVERALQSIEDNIKLAVAVGEIGLDYHKRVLAGASKSRQKEVLALVLDLARRYDKAVAFHSRYAWRDSFTMVRDSGVKRAVFHWYSGPTNVLRDILDQGYYVSATLAAAYHQEHRRVIKIAPLDRLLLETDAPVIYREGTEFERSSEPANVGDTLRAVAEMKGLEPAIVAASTTENALWLYGMSGLI